MSEAASPAGVRVAFGQYRYPRRGASVMASVDIAAPPAQVYAVVADVAGQPHWSPEVVEASWLPGAAPSTAGARFVGRNHVGRSRWSTICEVEVARPGEEFTFRVVRGALVARTRWSFRFEPLPGGGTRLSESFTTLRANPAPVRALLTMLRGGQDRAEALVDNLRASVIRLAEVVATGA